MATCISLSRCGRLMDAEPFKQSRSSKAAATRSYEPSNLFFPRCSPKSSFMGGKICCNSPNSGVTRRVSPARLAPQSKYLGKSGPPGGLPPAPGHPGVPPSSNYYAPQYYGRAPILANAGFGTLLIAVAIPVILGAFISSANKPTSDWYQTLEKPSWNPPDDFSVLVWTGLYALMGYASWLVWRRGGWPVQKGPLQTYAVQLLLNLLWPIVFFNFQNLGLALFNMAALCVAVWSTIQAFHPVDPWAAQLLWPYLAWVAFATVLNYNIWRNNRGGAGPSGTYMGGSFYRS